MIKIRAPFLAIVAWVALVATQASAQQKVEPHVDIDAADGVTYETNGLITATNGAIVHYITEDKSSNAVLTAERVSLDTSSHDIYAEGSVRLQREDQIWIGDKLHYNYETRQMDGEDFRTGKQPKVYFRRSDAGTEARAARTPTWFTPRNTP